MNEATQGEWPRNRDFPWAFHDELSQLQTAWNSSRDVLNQLQKLFSTVLQRETVACVAVSGSLNRMEAHADSDLDLLFVLDDRKQSIPADIKQGIYNQAWTAIAHCPKLSHLKPPKPGGIFAECVSWQSLVDETVRGKVNEDVTTFGQRMQLLMDAQPVLHDDQFLCLRRDVLNWYSETNVRQQFQEPGRFHWLWQDVERYWRSIRSRACWLHSESPTKAFEVNIKLRSSRQVLIAAFLAAIDSAHQLPLEEQSTVLSRLLRLTPLERITNAIRCQKESLKLLLAYQCLWLRAADGNTSSTDLTTTEFQALKTIRQSVVTNLARSAEWVM